MVKNKKVSNDKLQGIIADVENFVHTHSDREIHLIDLQKLIKILKPLQ